MNKVNWKAKLDYEFISNLKILQGAFDKLGIKKHIDVEKIARAKYQDNLELVQWFKRYYDVNCGGRGENYPAEERRGFVEPDFGFADKTVIPKTYNASGEITYAGTIQPKPKKIDPEPKKITPYTGPTYQNQNINYASHHTKPQGKSSSDIKL